MNKNETNKKTTIEALLAEMPVEPRRDFCDDVLAELGREKKLDTLLAEMPVAPSPDFTEKTLAKIVAEAEGNSGNAIAFPAAGKRIVAATNTVEFSRGRKIAAWISTAVVAAVALALSPIFPHNRAAAITSAQETSLLASRIANTVKSDPELYALCTEEESLSFDDLLEVSEILGSVDLSTLEMLAYNSD